MVRISEISAHNAAFKEKKHTAQVGVFVGATHGIGAGTLDAMAGLLHEPKLYVVGRSTTRFAAQRKRLEASNPSARIIFVEADVSLLAGVDRACAEIIAAESRVDFLFMSPGYFPANGPSFTSEGLETSFVLSYYARMRFISILLPLLSMSSQPRVLSVLAGGHEGKLQEDDLGLEQSCGTMSLVQQSTTLTTVALCHLAAQNTRVSFIHADPGLVHTQAGQSAPPPAMTFLARVIAAVIGMLFFVVKFFAAVEAEESGRRHAYILTSERFAAPGVHRVGRDCEPCAKSAIVDAYAESAWPGRVWDFTEGVWDRVLREG